MGHLLRRKGVKVTGVIGSVERFLGVAMSNIDQPSLVQEAHEDYLRAGSGIVTTNSYGCVPSIVGDINRTLEAIVAAGVVARAAADRHGALVAGCLPPLHESYRPDRVAPEEELVREYALIAEAIAPYADVLLCETMSSAREAVAAARAASATGKPVWVSWTLSEDMSGNLMSGESIEEAVDALQLQEDSPVAACLFNCSLPECVSVALPRLRAKLPTGVATGAYANGFTTVKSPGGGNLEYREDLSPHGYADICQAWAAGGSTIFGGCCGIFPEHISVMAKTARGEAVPAPEVCEVCEKAPATPMAELNIPQPELALAA